MLQPGQSLPLAFRRFVVIAGQARDTLLKEQKFNQSDLVEIVHILKQVLCVKG